jgi:nucleotide-binding universal stress UspA family protein
MTDNSDGYQHIVVALDGGDEGWAAFDHALRLARSAKGQLDALVAVPTASARATADANIAGAAIGRAGTYPITTFVVEGDPADAILDHVEQQHCDLIVMGCRSRLGPHPATSASTTTAVSDRSHVPVIMVRHISGDET